MTRRQLPIVGLAVLAVGGGAYALGRENAPDEADAEDAREAAYADALAAARADTEAAGRERGLLVGRKAGDRAGRAAGTEAGGSAGSTNASDELPASTVESCGPGEYNYQGRGCVPLDCPGAGCAHPPTPPATHESCPPGQVPAGTTGACAPP